MNAGARQLHSRACDLLEAAHGLTAAGTSVGIEPAMPAALACIEESLALLAISAAAMGGAVSRHAVAPMRGPRREAGRDAAAALEDLVVALRDARKACERAGREVGGLAGMPGGYAAARN